METLRSLRHAITRIRKPGSARPVPVAMAVRVLATSGVLISALALVGVGAADAATGGHASTDSHASAHSKKAGHKAKAPTGTANRNKAEAAKLPTVQPRRWMTVPAAKGPYLW
jgi:hypothetical protein